jgi:hypothetical protein
MATYADDLNSGAPSIEAHPFQDFNGFLFAGTTGGQSPPPPRTLGLKGAAVAVGTRFPDQATAKDAVHGGAQIFGVVCRGFFSKPGRAGNRAIPSRSYGVGAELTPP